MIIGLDIVISLVSFLLKRNYLPHLIIYSKTVAVPIWLAKAFRGEMVPQNPDDEPAEKLLERIKEEKARLVSEIKKTRKKITRKKE